MDMFNKHPDIVRQNADLKIERLHQDANNEVFARASRQQFRQYISKQIATYLRHLAAKLEPQIISQQSSPLTQNLNRQLR